MDTKTSSSIVGIGIGEEAFVDKWILVTDSNDCDVQITVDDLLEGIPPDDDSHRYVKVYYCDQIWWIHESCHFPI